VDKVFDSSKDVGFSPVMALCLAAITLVGIDGEFKEDELDKLRALLKADEMSFLKAFGFYNTHSLDMCIKVISARLDSKQKEILYKILYNLAHIDKEIAEAEKKLLSQYASAFELDEKTITSMDIIKIEDLDLSVFD